MPSPSLRYSVHRSLDHRKTARFTRRDVLPEEEADVPPPTQPIRVLRGIGQATPIQLGFGTTALAIERWDDRVVIALPGAVRLVGTLDQAEALIEALSAAVTAARDPST